MTQLTIDGGSDSDFEIIPYSQAKPIKLGDRVRKNSDGKLEVVRQKSPNQ